MRRRLALAVAVAAAAVPLVLVPASSGAGTAAKSKPKVVKVRDDYFSPLSVTAKPGKTVKWSWGNVNTDSHDVTLKKGPKGVKIKDFRSISGAIGISFRPEFKKTGKYNFYCTIHPEAMQMKVVIKK